MNQDPRIDTLLTLLAKHRDDLRTAYERVPPGLRETRPADDIWSAGLLLEHLAGTERAILQVVSGFAADAELRDGDQTFDRDAFERHVQMTAFLDRSRRIKGSQPKGALRADEAWAALEESRRELIDTLERARGRRLEAVSRPHPATGKPLDGYQWIAFLGLHEGRHAAQLLEIAASLQSR